MGVCFKVDSHACENKNTVHHQIKQQTDVYLKSLAKIVDIIFKESNVVILNVPQWKCFGIGCV